MTSLDGYWWWLELYDFPSCLHGFSFITHAGLLHRSLGEKSGLQISLLTTKLQSDDPILSGSLNALYSYLQRWRNTTRRKKNIPFYKAFKLVLRSLNSKKVRSCASRNPFSLLLAEANCEPISSISFVKFQVNMLLYKRVGNRAMHYRPCLGRTNWELLKGYRYSGLGGLVNIWTTSWDEPNNVSSWPTNLGRAWVACSLQWYPQLSFWRLLGLCKSWELER